MASLIGLQYDQIWKGNRKISPTCFEASSSHSVNDLVAFSVQGSGPDASSLGVTLPSTAEVTGISKVAMSMTLNV